MCIALALVAIALGCDHSPSGIIMHIHNVTAVPITLHAVLYFKLISNPSQMWEVLLLEYQGKPVQYSVVLQQPGEQSFKLLGTQEGLLQTSSKDLALLMAWEYALLHAIEPPQPIDLNLIPDEIEALLHGGESLEVQRSQLESLLHDDG